MKTAAFPPDKAAGQLTRLSVFSSYHKLAEKSIFNLCSPIYKNSITAYKQHNFLLYTIFGYFVLRFQ